MESVSRWRAPAAAFLASQCITLLGSAAVQMAIAWYAAVETRRALGRRRCSRRGSSLRWRYRRSRARRSMARFAQGGCHRGRCGFGSCGGGVAVPVTTVSGSSFVLRRLPSERRCARHARACRCRRFNRSCRCSCLRNGADAL